MVYKWWPDPRGRAHTIKHMQEAARVQSSLIRKVNNSDTIRTLVICQAIPKCSLCTLTCLFFTKIPGRQGLLLSLSPFYRCGNWVTEWLSHSVTQGYTVRKKAPSPPPPLIKRQFNIYWVCTMCQPLFQASSIHLFPYNLMLSSRGRLQLWLREVERG